MKLRLMNDHPHFTPIIAGWLNQVGRVLADLTEKHLRRGVFTSVPPLEELALKYIDARNEDAMLFIWTADANTILRHYLRTPNRWARRYQSRMQAIMIRPR